MTEQKEKLALFSMTADLGNGRTLGINFNTPLETEEGEINASVDKFRGIVDRQQARSALIGHIENIETQTRKIKHMREDIEDIDQQHARKAAANGGHKKEYRIPLQEQEVRMSIVKNLTRLEEDLEAMKKYQEKLEIEAGLAKKDEAKKVA